MIILLYPMGKTLILFYCCRDFFFPFGNELTNKGGNGFKTHLDWYKNELLKHVLGIQELNLKQVRYNILPTVNIPYLLPTVYLIGILFHETIFFLLKLTFYFWLLNFQILL